MKMLLCYYQKCALWKVRRFGRRRVTYYEGAICFLSSDNRFIYEKRYSYQIKYSEKYVWGEKI